MWRSIDIVAGCDAVTFRIAPVWQQTVSGLVELCFEEIPPQTEWTLVVAGLCTV